MKSYRANTDRIISADLIMAQPASYALLKQAEARKLDPMMVPRDVRNAMFLPGGDSPLYVARGDDWRGYLGGVLIHIFVPALDGSGMTGARIAAIFADPAAAKACWDCERTMKRGTAYFRYVDDHWIMFARYRSATPVRRRRRARWQVAPADWPRDKYGRPVSNRVAVQATQQN